jgi:tetratricopeptide (TPR) repeat protein
MSEHTGLRVAVRCLVIGLGLLAASSVAAPPVVAQIETGVMQGIVRDEEGKPLEGVIFRITDLERGTSYEVKSDRNGRFYRRGLRATDYAIAVEMKGYNPINDKLSLNAGVDRRFDFKLVRAAPEGAEEFAMGVAAFNKGDFEGAVTAFEMAVQKAPDLPEVRVNLAIAYLRLKRTADAVAELERASAISQGDPRLLFQLGGAYLEFNQLDKAAEALEKGLATSKPDSPDVYDATVTLGAVYFAKGDNDKSEAQFQKAVAARPDALTPKLGLGKVHASKGEMDQALRLFREVLAAAPAGSPDAAEADAFIKEFESAAPPSA